MNVSQLALRYWPVVLMLVVVANVAGVASYFSLPTREDPEITIREAVVTTYFEGLSAERVELLITKTLEEAIRQGSGGRADPEHLDAGHIDHSR
ncbi:RND superfamily efflux pump permease component protein [Salinisphaera shabanensis E1L3A]|uniref:RND superfamily efflux pump permease component protein n=1 Tax=Salinisphaera shabanensis E1L3A TaxID=1033802 RepID=U2EH90_9GAMM|nr:efflux RND transporter permease subunit [Salinisphaera shabanensis]ERJ17460.1 RND superfamily efflux pump permease component protein [Salinisphaera shabanensis E1L3A]